MRIRALLTESSTRYPCGEAPGFRYRERKLPDHVRGCFTHDAKPLFDPIDCIIFDGMNDSSGVERIVLFDGPAPGHVQEDVQRSIQRALEAGNYEWKTVRIGKDGRIQPERER